MMRSVFSGAVLPTLLSTFPAVAQNQVAHYRSSTAALASQTGASLTLLQRLPGDQICGATAMSGFSVTLQSMGGSTAQPFFYELRTNNPAVAVGAPDMVSGPITTAGPFSFPASMIPLAMRYTITFATPATFAARRSSPAQDLYSAVVLPAVVPGNSPLGVHVSQEDPRASGIGYGGVAGIAALSWSSVTGTGTASLLLGNLSLDLRAYFVDDVCQPYSQAPGLPPSFGQDGIFPNTAAGNGIGWRLLATKPAGSAALLLASPQLLAAPQRIAGVLGLLCLDPTRLLVLDTGITVSDSQLPAGTTRAVFGPYQVTVPASVDVFAQVLAIDLVSGPIELSTACRMNL